jgi:hypothetical protein
MRAVPALPLTLNAASNQYEAAMVGTPLMALCDTRWQP